MKVTIGGNRLGSGKKMVGRINNYFRSTHNLSEKFASSLAPGVLYPCLVKPAMRGDSFDITIDADARTIPTKGPLFGAFKLQLDVFQVPIRLYQGILHNNPIDIGLNMGQVKFPQLTIEQHYTVGDKDAGKFNDSCLLKYLGMSGIGTPANLQAETDFGRRINAIPMLAYYDIFKTYYANKQEENAYVISRKLEDQNFITTEFYGYNENNEIINFPIETNNFQTSTINDYKTFIIKFNNSIKAMLNTTTAQISSINLIEIGNDDNSIIIKFSDLAFKTKVYESALGDYNVQVYQKIVDDNTLQIWVTWGVEESDVARNVDWSIYVTNDDVDMKIYKDVAIIPYALKNIDKMREALLCKNELGSVFKIENKDDNTDWGTSSGADQTGLPYIVNVETDEYSNSLNKAPMNGLVLKTYQNDIFNNWLNTEWIEGENGINELTKVTVTDGKFSMDALNFAEKLYNMLNRIAVAGATYEAWQDVVYEQVKRRQIESPIYCGGMSRELMFDEVLQTTPTEDKPLGTIGGRGRLLKNTNKGGKLHIKCDEACFIIGIVSLTPRIFYTQGNEFYMTDLMSMDDFHKPEMDGIGFQDLIGERMAWFDTKITPNSQSVLHRSKIGKLPAWIEYMTSVDKAYADFAGGNGAGFMILNRNYEPSETNGIVDATTYIDPAKYNYAFADATLTAQNFWFEAAFNITARRLMSARIIPNV